jgi:hypothetical protein
MTAMHTLTPAIGSPTDSAIPSGPGRSWTSGAGTMSGSTVGSSETFSNRNNLSSLIETKSSRQNIAKFWSAPRLPESIDAPQPGTRDFAISQTSSGQEKPDLLDSATIIAGARTCALDFNHLFRQVRQRHGSSGTPNGLWGFARGSTWSGLGHR